jgi:putative transposase
MVLLAPEKMGNSDWFAAIKRRKTNVAPGRKAGKMPGFRVKHEDQRFVCWFNGGSNAVFQKTGKRSGTVTISGQNPTGHPAPDGTRRWKIVLHVRLSQQIRAYTSIRVNLTRRELVFVNAPVAVTGVKHAAVVRR